MNKIKYGFTMIRKAINTLRVKVCHGSHIQLDGIQGFRLNTKIITDGGMIKIGKKTALNDRVSLTATAGGSMTIGSHVSFNRNCIVICRKNIEIGDKCRFGPNVVIYDHDHVFSADGIQPGFRTGDVIIDKGCWVGAGAIILRNTHIGEESVIGAGTVVKGDIPPHSIVTSDRTLKVAVIRN